jgi:hypothetical protein
MSKPEPEPEIPVLKSTRPIPDWAIHTPESMLKDMLPGKEAIEKAGLTYKEPYDE